MLCKGEHRRRKKDGDGGILFKYPLRGRGVGVGGRERKGRGRRNNLEKVPVNFHTLHMERGRMEGGIGSLLKNSLHLVQALHGNYNVL